MSKHAPFGRKRNGNGSAPFQAGDDGAFEKIYRRHAKPLCGFIRRQAGLTMEEAEDAAQEILMRVHRNLKGFRFESRLSTYLYTAALRYLRDQRVRRRVELVDAPVEELGTARGADEESEGHELERQVRSLLAELSPAERGVWLLHETEERSWEEIAAIVGGSVRNAQLLKEKASRFLRERLGRLGFGEGMTGGGS
jgi:RNA polymerase sigma-70 factor (ECF subfamily)